MASVMKTWSGNWLAIETSSSLFSMAGRREDGRIASVELGPETRHSDVFFEGLEALRKLLQLEENPWAGLIVGRGPGSFTGLRIGFSVLKGFQEAWKIPIYGVSSMALIAGAEMLHVGESLGVVLDARRGKYFAAAYEGTAEFLKCTHEPALYDGDEIRTKFRMDKLVGSGLAPLGLASNADLSIAKPRVWYPRSREAFPFLSHGLAEKLDANHLVPDYMRISEPEEKLKR